jgi:hypothetical protein
LEFGKLWVYYLISYFWKLDILRDTAIIYEILFLDFGYMENVIWNYGSILRNKTVLEKDCEMFIKLLSRFLKTLR